MPKNEIVFAHLDEGFGDALQGGEHHNDPENRTKMGPVHAWQA